MKTPQSAMEELKAFSDIGGLCSTSEVCQITGCSPSFIAELLREGKLSGIKGKTRHSPWKIQRASVYRYFKAEFVESGT